MKCEHCGHDIASHTQEYDKCSILYCLCPGFKLEKEPKFMWYYGDKETECPACDSPIEDECGCYCGCCMPEFHKGEPCDGGC